MEEVVEKALLTIAGVPFEILSSRKKIQFDKEVMWDDLLPGISSHFYFSLLLFFSVTASVWDACKGFEVPPLLSYNVQNVDYN